MNKTIRDVAQRAGVAVSTVSLVINRKGRVSKKTEQRVLKAIEELNYHPQRVARGLVTKRSGNLGFILSSDHFSQAEPFYTKIFLGTEFEARSHDYYILLTTIEKQSGNYIIPRFLLEKNVDGIILAGTVPPKIIDYISGRNLPLVLVDYYPSRGNHSAVLIDNVGGIRQATQHLIGLGHKHIAFIGGDMSHPSMKERCQGFRLALEENDLPINAQSICCDQSMTGPADGFAATNLLLAAKTKFTAIVAANDAMAVGALRACRDQKIRIPEDVAITGFDDVETAITARPTLTTVQVPKEEMGTLAVRHLVNIINGTASKGTKMIIPVKLICRESTGCKAHKI